MHLPHLKTENKEPSLEQIGKMTAEGRGATANSRSVKSTLSWGARILRSVWIIKARERGDDVSTEAPRSNQGSEKWRKDVL